MLALTRIRFRRDAPQSAAGTPRTPKLRKRFRAQLFGVRRVLAPLFGAGRSEHASMLALTRIQFRRRATKRCANSRTPKLCQTFRAQPFGARRVLAPLFRARHSEHANMLALTRIRFRGTRHKALRGRRALQGTAKPFGRSPLECGAPSRRISARALGAREHARSDAHSIPGDAPQSAAGTPVFAHLLRCLDPAAEDFGDAPRLSDATARRKGRFRIEDFADRADARFIEVRGETLGGSRGRLGDRPDSLSARRR